MFIDLSRTLLFDDCYRFCLHNLYDFLQRRKSCAVLAVDGISYDFCIIHDRNKDAISMHLCVCV